MKIGELIEKIKNEQKTANIKQVYQMYQVYHSDINPCNNDMNNGTPDSTPNGTALLFMYESSLEDIAAKYKARGLEYLEKYNKELFAEIQAAEGNLNLVWDRTLKGRFTVDNFKEALCRWHGAQMKGVEVYIKRKEVKKIECSS